MGPLNKNHAKEVGAKVYSAGEYVLKITIQGDKEERKPVLLSAAMTAQVFNAYINMLEKGRILAVECVRADHLRCGYHVPLVENELNK